MDNITIGNGGGLGVGIKLCGGMIGVKDIMERNGVYICH